MRLTTRQLFTALLFIAIFILALSNVADPDFWWHLRTGQWMVSTGSIPHVDPFSFTKSGVEWTAHAWLSELVIYGIHQAGGFPLLILIFAIVTMTSFWLVYLRSPKDSKPFIAGFTLLLGALATAPTWGARPQMFSLLLSSIFLYLLDRYFEKRELKWILPLPFITILWVNLHAGFALGIGIVAIYIFGDGLGWLRSRISGSSQKGEFTKLLPLAGVLIACTLAVIVNPNGTRMYAYPFETLFSPAMQKYIQEWFSPDFHQIEWQPLAWLMLALITFGLIAPQRTISTAHIILTIIFGYAALRSMRHVPLFSITVVPVLAGQAASIIQTVKKSYFGAARVEGKTNPSLLKWINILVLATTILAAGIRFISITQKQLKTEKEVFPVAAVDWIVQHQPEGNIFNTYRWGGYLAWRLYPKYPVFIDGRADLYGDNFIETYLDIYQTEPGWENSLEEYDVNVVVAEKDAPIGYALTLSMDWELVFSDNKSLLFVRR